MRVLPLVAAVAALLTLSTQAGAATITYNDFSSTAGLTINGDAAQVGNVLRVTPALDSQAGSFFSTTAVSLAANASFSTFFQFLFTSPDFGFCDGIGCGADGLVFVLQTVGNNVGGAGGGIGYDGVLNSVGIEFDNWNNGAIDDNSSNHVGIDVGGDVDSLVTQEITEADLNNGQIWSAWIDYDGGTNILEVRLNQSGIRPLAAILTLNRNLALDLGQLNAFVGFTSGTGSSHANHDVLSWQLEDHFAPIPGTPVPEPTSLVLLGSGLIGAGVRRYKKRRAS